MRRYFCGTRERVISRNGKWTQFSTDIVGGLAKVLTLSMGLVGGRNLEGAFFWGKRAESDGPRIAGPALDLAPQKSRIPRRYVVIRTAHFLLGFFGDRCPGSGVFFWGFKVVLPCGNFSGEPVIKGGGIHRLHLRIKKPTSLLTLACHRRSLIRARECPRRRISPPR